MSSWTVQQHLDLHFDGDASRVEFVHLDHAQVRTEKQLRAWARRVFGLRSVRGLTPLFFALGERGQSYIVIEHHFDQATPAVRGALDGDDGWQKVLGFHLERDYGVYVSFFRAEDATGYL